MRDIETFDNFLGGTLDMRPGSLGGTNAKTRGAWINAASFSLTSAGQDMAIVLEVYGPGRQTFLLELQNDSQKTNVVKFMHLNHFGTASAVFSNAKLVSSGSGLSTNTKLFFQMANDGCQDIPVIWYLKGVSLNDNFAVSNIDMTSAPAGGSDSQLIDTNANVGAKLDGLLSAVGNLQTQVDTFNPTKTSAAISDIQSQMKTDVARSSSVVDLQNQINKMNFSHVLNSISDLQKQIQSIGSANAAIQATPVQTGPTLTKQPLKWSNGGDYTRYLDCEGASCSKPANRVQIWQGSGVPGQFWTYANRGVTSGGYCLATLNNGINNGTPVIAWPGPGGIGGQEWVWKQKGDGWQLMNPMSGKCLDIAGGADSNGSVAQLWDCATSTTKWKPVLPGQ